jgi:hypothetical protein
VPSFQQGRIRLRAQLFSASADPGNESKVACGRGRSGSTLSSAMRHLPSTHIAERAHFFNLPHPTVGTPHLPAFPEEAGPIRGPLWTNKCLAYHDGGRQWKAFSGSEKPFHLVMRRLAWIVQSGRWTALNFHRERVRNWGRTTT